MRVLTCLATVLVSAAAVAPDPGSGSAGPAPKLSLEVRNKPLRRALDELFAGSGLKYTVEALVPDVPITLALRDVEPETALRILTRLAAKQAAGVTFVRRGEGYSITRNADGGAGDALTAVLTDFSRGTATENVKLKNDTPASMVAKLYGVPHRDWEIDVPPPRLINGLQPVHMVKRKGWINPVIPHIYYHIAIGGGNLPPGGRSGPVGLGARLSSAFRKDTGQAPSGGGGGTGSSFVSPIF